MDFRRIVLLIGIVGFGLVAGFFIVSVLMPPTAPRHASAGAAPSAPAAQSTPVEQATPAETPHKETPPAPHPSTSATPVDDLHNPERWNTAQRGDTDVEYDDIGTPSPGATRKPPGKPGQKPARPTHDAQGEPEVDSSRARDLEKWKQQITNYSRRHYGEATWQLQPTCIVLHFTAGTSFPENLASSSSFDGEAPGLASHYVIDGDHIWLLVPPDVRSRGAYGINHRAINIEMIAANAGDLARRPKTLQSCVRLVRWLMQKYGIPKDKIYSHQAVSRMNKREIPEALDLLDPRPYGKPDPGEQNMRTVKSQL